MKRIITLALFAMLLNISASAFYPAFDFRYGRVTYPQAVMDIEHDADHIYVAKLDGLVVIDKATGEKTIYSSQLGTLDYTPSALALQGGELWIGTLEGKLLNLKNGEFIVYDYGMDTNLSNIVFDHDGMMYVTSARAGFLINPWQKTVEQFETYWWGFPGWTGHLCIDNDDMLWIANYGLQGGMSLYGLATYTPNDGTTYVFKENRNLRSGNVFAMDIDNDGKIWYVNGEYQLQKLEENEVQESYDLSDVCFDMLFDDKGDLWLAGSNGPLMVMKDGEFINYPCDMDSKRWLCLDIDGDAIYIGTDEALLKFQDGSFTTLDVSITDQTSTPDLTGVDSPAVEPSAAGNQQWFDLQGRRVTDKPRSGVYIQDGRKRIAK